MALGPYDGEKTPIFFTFLPFFRKKSPVGPLISLPFSPDKRADEPTSAPYEPTSVRSEPTSVRASRQAWKSADKAAKRGQKDAIW